MIQKEEQIPNINKSPYKTRSFTPEKQLKAESELIFTSKTPPAKQKILVQTNTPFNYQDNAAETVDKGLYEAVLAKMNSEL